MQQNVRYAYTLHRCNCGSHSSADRDAFRLLACSVSLMTSRSRRPRLHGVALTVAPFVLSGCFDCDALERARVRAPGGNYEAVRWQRECGTLYQGDIIVTIVPVGE